MVTMIGKKTDALCGAIAKLYLDERIEFDLNKLANDKKLVSARKLKRKAKDIEKDNEKAGGSKEQFFSCILLK